MKKYLFAVACMTFALCSCDKNDAVTNEQSGIEVPGEVANEKAKAALQKRYPEATDITWSAKGNYTVATFNLPASARGAVTKARYTAWFDTHGEWCMTTERDHTFEALPQAVKHALAQSEYNEAAGWRVDEVDRINRDGAEAIYVIEVEKTTNGVTTEIDLYYSADGVLVKKVTDVEADDDYDDYLPTQPATNVEAFIREKYPQARIVDIDNEGRTIEVEILDGATVREVVFNASSDWLHTRTEVRYAQLPATVKGAFEASQYKGYQVDEVDHYDTPTGEYYLLELEQGEKEVEIRIHPNGTFA